MAHTYHYIFHIVFLTVFLISFAYCEEINFNITTNPAKDELTMRCFLNDTSSEITFVQSISIKTHSGSVVASITAHRPARMEENSTGVAVSGKLQQKGQERGFLNIVWKHPIPSMNGMYQCQISGVDKKAHVKTLHKEKYVGMFKVERDDIINSIRGLKLANDAQNAKIAELKKRQDTRVIFTAVNNADVYVADGTNVVFPRVIINVGGGYDRNTGVFTCPVAGYYTFQVHITGANDKNAEVSIKRNGNRLTSAGAMPSYGHQSGSNAANVRLYSGDRVTVTAIQHSTYLHGEDFTSFSGHLISLA